MQEGYPLPYKPPYIVVNSKKKGDSDPELVGKGTNYILEMKVVNTDAASYVINTPEKRLLTTEREKKCKYLDA